MAPASCNATSHFDSPAKIFYPQPHRARRIADDIAGMTDRYALQEHARYFEQTPELRDAYSVAAINRPTSACTASMSLVGKAEPVQ